MTQKEINEFLANTKVYVNGKNKEIQEKLFGLGYKWIDGGVNLDCTKSPFLFIYENMIFAQSSDMEYFSSHENREISAKEILSLELTEPKYRPFKSHEECWQEMLKHQPFGWIRGKYSAVLYHIDSIASDRVACAFGNHMNFDFIIKNYEFADGTPLGIKEG